MNSLSAGVGTTTPFHKMKMAFCAILVAAIGVVLWALGVTEFIDNLGMLEDKAIAAQLSVWVPSIVAGLPMFFLLSYGFVLKMVGKDNGSHFQNVTNVAIAFVLLAIVVRLPSGFLLDDYLQDRGYAKCFYYISPANFSPTAWVRSPNYCIEEGAVVRRPLMKWLQALPNGGRDVTHTEVREKALELLSAYEKGERVFD